MVECPTCKGAGEVPNYIAAALNGTGNNKGATCHCDGPPHTYSPNWCPSSGPVTGRK